MSELNGLVEAPVARDRVGLRVAAAPRCYASANWVGHYAAGLCRVEID